MLRFVKIKCHFCHKQFYKDKRHFNWNKKLGHNSFCSKKCETKYRLTGKWLSCENTDCKRNFYRSKSDILKYNYCSRSCAAAINNKKYPKWPIKYCKNCKEPFRREGSPYCSVKCGKLGRFRYTKKELVDLLKSHFNKNGRVPARREVPEISHKATHLFNSWNKALIAAGLEPHRSHDHRMYKRLKAKAQDGHLCDSTSEAIIDNWLYKNKVRHSRNVPYPNTGHLSDWATKNDKIFIEYFGLAKDSPRYDRSIREKITMCRKNKIKLIGVYPKDLYPTNKLDKILSKLA